MGLTALRNRKGMTLIEIMISIMILAIVSLALMQTALLGMRENLKNAMRTEAMNVLDQRLNELRNTNFNHTDLALASNVTETAISRRFRAFSVTYQPVRTVQLVGADTTTKQVTLSVSWLYSGQTTTYSVTTIMRQL